MRSVFIRFLILSSLFAQCALGAPRDPAALAPPQGAQVSKHITDKAYPGVTLYPVRKSRVLLLDMQGGVINSWKVPAVRARLLPSCNLLVVHDGEQLSDVVTEYSWDGEIVWKYKAKSGIHHDVRRLDNGNTIFPIRRQLRYEIPSKDGVSPPRQAKMRSDTVLEVTPKGEMVWEWHADEYLDTKSWGANKAQPPYDSIKWTQIVRDWSHLNTVSVIPPNKWHDQGDKRFKPGNIMVLLRNLWSVYVIDKDTKEITWTYTGDYKGGMIFPHESHLLPKDLPGAGNVLIFDNGRDKRGSFILEVNPATNKVVWSYEDGMRFFSKGQGSVQRLPNGNTLISEDDRGRVFEVTPQKEIVWEYLGNSILRRAHRYSYDYCPKAAEVLRQDATK
ncbi:MAG: hypothetical protein DCC75_02170 [Proteobacteria bacterium]|nr:MAG: hypothetical protein DCC75_02170 [Pseudomonadota bacterium]